MAENTVTDGQTRLLAIPNNGGANFNLLLLIFFHSSLLGKQCTLFYGKSPRSKGSDLYQSVSVAAIGMFA